MSDESAGDQSEGSAGNAGESAPATAAPRRKRGPDRQPRRARARDEAPPRTARAVSALDDPRLKKAMDGWGNPLHVEGPPGWDWYWCTQHDLGRWNRPWTQCKWGVDKVTINGLSGEGVAKGTPIRFNELSLYKMRSEHTAAIRESDPNRLRHKALWEYAQAISETGFTHPVAHGGQPDDMRPHSAGMAGRHPVGDRSMQFIHQQFDLR